MADYAIVDTSRAPIVHVKVLREPDDENYQRYLDDLGAAFRECDRFAMVFDTQDLNRFPAKYRQMQSRWLDETRPEFEGRWVSSAFVIRSRVIRGVLMTLFWVSPPYYAQGVFKSEEEALAWTHEQLAKAGVER